MNAQRPNTRFEEARRAASAARLVCAAGMMCAARIVCVSRPVRAARVVRAARRVCAALLMAAACVQPLRADGLEGRFEVRSADLELESAVYHMNARLALPISDAVRRGLNEGVPLNLELDIEIERVRQLLPNSRIAELTQRYHLEYNAVSARYTLRNVNSGTQESLATVDAALERLSDIRDLPVLDRPLVATDRRYEANLRAKLDYGTVPFTLRLVMFWVSDWHRESDWYTWTFQP